MSNRLPVEVNPFRLIEQRRQLSGSVQSRQLPRLQEFLATEDEQTGDFAVTLDFTRSSSRLPMIQGQVKGQAAVVCQRCLEPLQLAIDAEINVVLTASQTDRRPEEAGYELCVIEDERLFLQDFIEDEILLALPAVPRHETCAAPLELREIPEHDADSEEPIAGEEKQNPFAVLKDWKKTE